MSHTNYRLAPREMYYPTTPNSGNANANGLRTNKGQAPTYPALNHSSGAKWIKNLTQDRLSQFNGGHFADVNLASVLFTRKEDGADFVKLQVYVFSSSERETEREPDYEAGGARRA
jgi:hypothetical protein